MSNREHSTSTASIKSTQKEKAQTIRKGRHDTEHPFVMISKELLLDRTISPKAKGILCFMLAKPADWKTYTTSLMKELNVGKDYIYSAFKELESAGYLIRTPQQDEKGRMDGVLIEFFEEKQKIKEKITTNGFSGSGKPASGKPATTNIERVIIKKETNTVCVESPKPVEKPKPAKPASAPSSLRCGTQSFYKVFVDPHIKDSGLDPNKFEVGLTEQQWDKLIVQYAPEKIIRCAQALSRKLAQGGRYKNLYLALINFLKNDFEEKKSFQKPVTAAFVKTGNKGDVSFFPKSALEDD